ncbi:MAG: phosphatidate cytidylyltransferase [Firmicutes bacterium]|nr:phosphatidate cytidylyltransferase [Bacillota bacterium]
MNQVQPEFQKRFSNRVMVALILAAIAIPAIIAGGWFIILFALIGLIFATQEILNVKPDSKYPLPIRIFVYLMLVMMIYYVFIYNNFIDFGFDFSQWSFATGLNTLELPTLVLTILALTLFFSSITDVRFKVPDATYLITMSLMLSLSFQSFLFLRFFPDFIFGDASRTMVENSLLLLYAGVGTFSTDIGAYLVGTFFGSHKMNVRVSKNKTWEGFFGGLASSFIVSFAFAWIADAFGSPLLPFLTMEEWYWLVLLSVSMPLIATLGDFTFSLIKREFGIKNFSNILGEHGGILDRVDSFSMVVLVVTLIISFIFDFVYALPI